MQVSPAANLNPIAPAAPSQAGGTAPAENSPFAKMLNAHKAPPKPESKPGTGKPQAEPGGDTAEVDDGTTAEASKKPQAGRRGPARVDLREHATREKKTAEASTEPVALAQDKVEAEPVDAQAPEADPSLTEFVAAALSKPVAPQAPQAPVAGSVPGDAAKAIAGVAGPATPALPAAEAHAAGPRPAQDTRVDVPVREAAKEGAKPMGTKELEAIADARPAAGGHPLPGGVREVAEPFKLPELPAASPVAAAAASRAEAGTAVAAPTASVNISTPATSPEFREALGVQVSVLAKDGIQRAELHLNPAEMGPISVQIAIDGTQARVDFGVDSSTTRQIIESGLPELAASLRDAGFTLAGGGVSQQSREKHEGGQGEPRFGMPGERGRDEVVATQRVSVRVPQGAVDLYA